MVIKVKQIWVLMILIVEMVKKTYYNKHYDQDIRASKKKNNTTVIEETRFAALGAFQQFHVSQDMPY